MKEYIKTVYNVRRIGVTKTITVGDYLSLEEAERNMVNHYNTTPKRGRFDYCIMEEELWNYDGVVAKEFSSSLSGRGKCNFYKRYTMQEIELLRIL